MHPIPPHPSWHHSGEPAGEPVSLISPCCTLVHDAAQIPTNPEFCFCFYKGGKPVSGQMSPKGLKFMHSENGGVPLGCNCELPQCVHEGIPQSADEIQRVSEAEHREWGMMGGREGCCESSNAAQSNAELRRSVCACICLTHSDASLLSTVFYISFLFFKICNLELIYSFHIFHIKLE